ncbi:MAG: hypothetical protein J6Y72_05420 [Bacteroidales bacterium]|nr:hypothetical protein [Bacteroidales bacterium]
MTKISNGLKLAGKGCFAVAVIADAGYVIDAVSNNRTDKNQRCVKAILDVTFGAIGVWGGPVGWVASGTYFLVDMCGGVDYLLGIKEDY